MPRGIIRRTAKKSMTTKFSSIAEYQEAKKSMLPPTASFEKSSALQVHAMRMFAAPVEDEKRVIRARKHSVEFRPTTNSHTTVNAAAAAESPPKKQQQEPPHRIFFKSFKKIELEVKQANRHFADCFREK